MSQNSSVTREAFDAKYQQQLCFDEPISYEDVLFYPVEYADIIELNQCVQCLIFDPLDYPNEEYAVLPRLYFLTEPLKHKDDIEWNARNITMVTLCGSLCKLCELIFKGQKVTFAPKNGYWQLQIDDKSFTAKQFESFRIIILEQNGFEVNDEFIHNDIKKYIEAEEANDKEPKATLEDCQEAIMLELKCSSVKELKSMSVRRFNRLVPKILHRENYVICYSASMSGLVSFKGDIPHWLSKQRSNALIDKYFLKK